MATRLTFQLDKRSFNTFGVRPSDTTTKARLIASTNTIQLVPTGFNFVLITVTGNHIYYAINEVPTLPISGGFVVGPGEQINNGATKPLAVIPGEQINCISDAVADVQFSFYVNELVE